MYLLIAVAGYIQIWPTIGLVMLTAVIGVALLKRQGLATLTRGMNRMNSGEMPATEMAEGILLAIAGALLLTPGFVTDAIGFTLLFPPSRWLIAKEMLKRVKVHAVGGMQSGGGSFGAGFNSQSGSPQGMPPGFGQPSTHQTHRSPQAPKEQASAQTPVTLEGDFEHKK